MFKVLTDFHIVLLLFSKRFSFKKLSKFPFYYYLLEYFYKTLSNLIINSLFNFNKLNIIHFLSYF